MNALFEEITDDGRITSVRLTNVLVEEVDENYTIHADNGFFKLIPKELVIDMDDTDEETIFTCSDETRVSFVYEES